MKMMDRLEGLADGLGLLWILVLVSGGVWALVVGRDPGDWWVDVLAVGIGLVGGLLAVVHLRRWWRESRRLAELLGLMIGLALYAGLFGAWLLW